MKKNIFRNVLLVCGGILLLAWLLEKSRAIYFQEHQRYSLALSKMREEFGILDQNLLQYRYDLTARSTLVFSSLTKLQKLQKELAKIPDYIDEDGQQQMQPLLTNNATIINKKLVLTQNFIKEYDTFKQAQIKLLNRFQANHNNFNNYLRYFSVEMIDVLDDVLIYSFTSEPAMIPKLQIKLATLNQAKSTISDDLELAIIEEILIASEQIINGKKRVETLSQTLSAMPTSQTVEKLESAYIFHYQEANETIGYYQFYASALLTAMLLIVFYLFLRKLQLLNDQIKNLNQQLQQENIRLASEIEITRKIQKMLLPKDAELAICPELDIAGFMEPAEEVGGDYYDVLYHHGRLKIAIGDVTGHGLESGVLMIMLQTAIRTLLESNQTDPQAFLNVLNWTMYQNIQRINSDKNLTLILLDYDQGMLRLSGQHEEVLLVHANDDHSLPVVERIDTIDLGFPIGLEADINDFIGIKEFALNAGDAIVLYTDGLTEAENNQKVQYGLERLIKIISSHHWKTASEMRQAIIDDLHSHINQHQIYDDITLLIIKHK